MGCSHEIYLERIDKTSLKLYCHKIGGITNNEVTLIKCANVNKIDTSDLGEEYINMSKVQFRPGQSGPFMWIWHRW